MNTNNQAWRNQHSEVDAQNGHQPRTSSTAGRLAKQYNVSRNTIIMRDAKLTETIDAIGEYHLNIRFAYKSGRKPAFVLKCGLCIQNLLHHKSLKLYNQVYRFSNQIYR